jgi:hypothetical protein
MFNKQAFIEATKELGRVVLLAVIPLAISYFEQNKGIDWRALAIVALLATLRWVDKFLHETGKAIDAVAPVKSVKDKPVTSVLTGGLTRF